MIRPARVSDLCRVAELVRSSFDAHLGRYMVYAQHGAADFLATYIQNPELSADRDLLVAVDDIGNINGFAEFRVIEGQSAHLSYICVDPNMRGRGLASEIIRHFMETSGIRDIDLYVFADNAAAVSLYKKLGLQIIGTTHWFTRPLPEANSASVIVTDLPASLAAFDRFGFCQFQVRTALGIQPIGRIGAGVLRCPNSTIFADDALLASLASAFPETQEALLISAHSPDVGHIVNRSIRMRGTLAS